MRFLNPFMAFTNEEILSKQLVDCFKKEFHIPEAEVRDAVSEGWKELAMTRLEMQKKGEEVLKYMEEHHRRGIVLAGRPYHVDPEINHGIPEMITSYGMCVLTEDSISHLGNLERPLIVMDQWMYHSRLYSAANYVKTRDDLDLIQLNSFGCGLDAVTTDCVSDILTNSGKIYTCLKIDEVNNLGAARIRIRSLLAAIRAKEKQNRKRNIQVKFYVTTEEKELMEQKMVQLQTKRIGAYLRKMAIDGYIIYVDTRDIKEMNKLLSAIGRNINQIAKRVNAGGPTYQADMEEIRERLDQIWQLQRRILSSQR